MILQTRAIKNVKLNKTKFQAKHRFVSYIQGQEPEPKVREYFYYIDHEGMINDSSRYQTDFPYVSPCGRERNFIRCDDTPIVFTHVIKNTEDSDKLQYNHAGDILQIAFQPKQIYMNPDTGRVYHPAWPKVGNIGLIRSKLSIELSKYFEFEDGENNAPSHIWWKGKKHLLQNDWIVDTKRYGINSNKAIQ